LVEPRQTQHLEFDAPRWVGQGPVLIDKGPKVVEDFALGGLTLHPNIIAGAAAATYALKLIGIDLSPRTIAWDVM
jgi:hypothetical protein